MNNFRKVAMTTIDRRQLTTLRSW